MTTTRTISIPHLGRVEGHGGIFVKVVDQAVAEVNMDIHEGSRYYEALLVGKHFLEVQGIITRVCAICSANHTVTALQALESALGIPQSPRVHCLRGLMLRGAAIESHALHVFALALPDFLGFDSVISMASKYPGEVAAALRLKQLGNKVQTLIGGRAVHPINTLVGGFGKVPAHRDLERLRDELAAGIDVAMGFVRLAATIPVPDFAARPTVFVALRPYDGRYRFRQPAREGAAERYEPPYQVPAWGAEPDYAEQWDLPPWQDPALGPPPYRDPPARRMLPSLDWSSDRTFTAL